MKLCAVDLLRVTDLKKEWSSDNILFTHVLIYWLTSVESNQGCIYVQKSWSIAKENQVLQRKIKVLRKSKCAFCKPKLRLANINETHTSMHTHAHARTHTHTHAHTHTLTLACTHMHMHTHPHTHTHSHTHAHTCTRTHTHTHTLTHTHSHTHAHTHTHTHTHTMILQHLFSLAIAPNLFATLFLFCVSVKCELTKPFFSFALHTYVRLIFLAFLLHGGGVNRWGRVQSNWPRPILTDQGTIIISFYSLSLKHACFRLINYMSIDSVCSS